MWFLSPQIWQWPRGQHEWEIEDFGLEDSGIEGVERGVELVKEVVDWWTMLAINCSWMPLRRISWATN